MEMDFTVHRALYPISVLTCLTLLSACNNKDGDSRGAAAAVPNTWVHVNHSKVHQQQGVLYYNSLPYSGYVYHLFPNSDTLKQTSYIQGKEEGWVKIWYNNRQLNELRFYIKGNKEGIHKGWWSDGTPKFEYRFHNNEHDGELKEWYANGRMARWFHYTKGYEEGSQKMWWENGDVRANYVVKDGERYGLTGQRLCTGTSTAKHD